MKKSSKKLIIVRQGDVLLMGVAPKDVDLEEDPTRDARGLVLAEGETSGHHHAVFGAGARLMRYKAAGQRVVVISTVDADGTRRVYHVPCHPELRPLLPDGGLGEPQKMTALAAVASTYGLTAKQYVLECET